MSLRTPVVRRRPARLSRVIGKFSSRTLELRAFAWTTIGSPGAAITCACNCSASSATIAESRRADILRFGVGAVARAGAVLDDAKARVSAAVASAWTWAMWSRTSLSICLERSEVFTSSTSPREPLGSRPGVNGYG